MKKCIICEEEAQYCIKDTSDYYCQGCASEQFGDINVLVAIEDQAQSFKKTIDKEIEDIKIGKIKRKDDAEQEIEVDEDAIAYTINKEED